MDIKLVENGNGGDMQLSGNDLASVNSFQNMIYAAMFGGNVQASTPAERLADEQAFDFWGNTLLWPNEPSLQFNSQTERTLNDVALNSAGRLLIEEAVRSDLSFMTAFATLTVSASIASTDRVEINIQVVEKQNLQEKQYIYIWDTAKNEIVETTD